MFLLLKSGIQWNDISDNSTAILFCFESHVHNTLIFSYIIFLMDFYFVVG
jgi:hypothetical protein